MDIQDLRKMTIKELRELSAETEGKLRALRFRLASGNLKKVREIRQTRKLIAQIKTILKEFMSSNNSRTGI